MRSCLDRSKKKASEVKVAGKNGEVEEGQIQGTSQGTYASANVPVPGSYPLPNSISQSALGSSALSSSGLVERADRPSLSSNLIRPSAKARQQKGKAVIEAEEAAKRKREKARDGALTWEIPPVLEVPKALQEPKDEGHVQEKSRKRAREHPLFAIFRQPLQEVSQRHLIAVSALILKANNVEEAGRWTPIISCLASQAAASLSPTLINQSHSMDPRDYVKVKRVAEAEPEDSCVVHGVVMRKNLTHRKMRRKIDNARVLMLGGSFEFPRTQSRLASFDTYTKDQETEHLRSAVENLTQLKPDVLLVEKSVARDAQDALLDCNISLALNVKRANLDRLALCSGVTVATSLSKLTPECIAVCKEFELEDTEALACSAQEASKEEKAIDETEHGEKGQYEEGKIDANLSEDKVGPEAVKSSIPKNQSQEDLNTRLDKVPNRRSMHESSVLKTSRMQSEGSTDITYQGSKLASKSMKQGGSRCLMHFQGCKLDLGCTVILKGESAEQLAKLKTIFKFMLYCAYRARLEAPFLMAELASAWASESAPRLPPASPPTPDKPPTTSEEDTKSNSLSVGSPVKMDKEIDGKLSPGSSPQFKQEESPSKTRFGVSWKLPSLGKGVGSRVNPAMAALMATKSAGMDDLPAELAPKLLGLSQEDLLSQSRRLIEDAYPIGILDLYSSASPFSCLPLSNKNPALNSKGSGTSLLLSCSETNTTPMYSPQKNIAEVARDHILPVLRIPGLSENLSDLKGEKEHAENLIALPARSMILERLDSQVSSCVSELEQEMETLESLDRANKAIYDQELVMSVGKRNPNKALLCEPPKMEARKYYQPPDETLAAFLSSFLPTSQKPCSNNLCAEPPMAHMLSFLHDQGSISFTMTVLPDQVELPGADRGDIWFWARPEGDGPEVSDAVRRVLLPKSAGLLSISHFLELSFGLEHFIVNGRPLHHCYARYFGLGSIVACFHHETVSPNVILMPAPQIAYSQTAHRVWLEEEAEQLIEEANSLFTSINDALGKLDDQCKSQAVPEMDESALQLLRSDLATQGDSLSDDVLELCSKLEGFAKAHPEKDGECQGQEGSLQDLTQCVWNINAIRRALAKLSQTWANRLQHPEKAAAIIQMSRENSSEAFTSQPEFLPKSEDTFHSRTPSTVEGAMSLEGKATGLKMLVNNILAGTEEVERLGTPRAETSKEIEKNPEKDEKEQKGGKAEDSLQREDLGDNTSSETREEITTITSSPNHSPFLARSLASEREEANLEDVEENKEEQKEDEKGKIGNKARMLMKSFTAPSERTKPESSGNRTFSPVRQELMGSSKVSDRIAAFEQANTSQPLLRSISRPNWIRLNRQRSTTDNVLSWLNAGRLSTPSTIPEFTAASTSPQSEASNSETDSLSESSQSPKKPIESPLEDEIFQADDSQTKSPVKGKDVPAEEFPPEVIIPEPKNKDWLVRASLDVQPNLTDRTEPPSTERDKGAREQRTVIRQRSLESRSTLPLPPAQSQINLASRSSAPLPNIKLHPNASVPELRVLEREDSQMDSHFDLSKWGDILKHAPTEELESNAASEPPTLPSQQAIEQIPRPPIQLPLPLPKHIHSGSEAGTSGISLQFPSALTAILTSRKVEPTEIPPFFGDLQGRALLASGPSGNIIVVRDDEPTSIVAYFLASRNHAKFLEEAADCVLEGKPRPSTVESGPNPKSAPSIPDLPAIDALTARPIISDGEGEPGKPNTNIFNKISETLQGSRNASWTRLQELERASISTNWKILLATDPLHYQDSIQDDNNQASGKAKLQVIAWYAPQFAELRARSCSGGEEAFISSLSRNRAWEARGGKTRSYFAKTADDRYIVKQLQGPEKKTFQEIAPAYFRYLAGCMRHGSRSCLAKIMGVYTVTVKPSSGKETVMDILVMENIFYDRDLFPVYDLKGSERARLARDDPSDPARVLMDENLIQSNLHDPILLKCEEHTELEHSLWNDTAFLSQLGVMDYSLLVGVDKSSNTLVVGIIDFIRQYTWDKALERWVKSGMGLSKDLKAPTIQSPKEYCRRFRAAMGSYFTKVPNAQTQVES